MLPAMGSTITQAISPPIRAKVSRTCAASLKASVTVCCASAFGTPGEDGTPNVRAPEPALINSESEWP